MNKATKLVVGIVILILVIGGIAIYFLKFRTSNQQIDTQQTTQQEEKKQDEIKVEEPKKVETIILDGVVSKVTNQDIEVQNGEIKNTLLFNQNVSVILVSGGGVERKDISYLKSGQKISVTINQSDSSVISIQVLEGENTSKVF